MRWSIGERKHRHNLLKNKTAAFEALVAIRRYFPWRERYRVPLSRKPVVSELLHSEAQTLVFKGMAP